MSVETQVVSRNFIIVYFLLFTFTIKVGQRPTGDGGDFTVPFKIVFLISMVLIMIKMI